MNSTPTHATCVNDENATLTETEALLNLKQVFVFCSVYQNQVKAVSAFATLKSRQVRHLAGRVLASSIISSLIYASVSAFGYLIFGNCVQSNIIFNNNDASVYWTNISDAIKLQTFSS